MRDRGHAFIFANFVKKNLIQIENYLFRHRNLTGCTSYRLSLQGLHVFRSA